MRLWKFYLILFALSWALLVTATFSLACALTFALKLVAYAS